MTETSSPQRRSRKNVMTGAPVADAARIPPQAVDAEQAVLGAMMTDRNAFSMSGHLLKPESFYEPRHQMIFAAISSLASAQRPIDILTVKDQLQKDGNLDAAGGPYYLMELSSSIVSAAHILDHTRIVAQKALARELITLSNDVQRASFDETQDVDDLLHMTEAKVFEISQRNFTKDYTQIDPIIGQAYKAIQDAAAKGGGITGLASGFHQIDKYTAGWQNSDLIIIAARPAMGKTAFMLSMAKNMAINYHYPVAFFSLEMSNLQLVNRLISNVCELESDKIKTGQLTDEEWQRLDFKINELLHAPLYVDDTPSLSIMELKSKARRLVREHGVKIIMIDYLQLMNASGMSYGNRQEEVSMISRHLKGLAKELNIPIIALSQLNRGVETRISDNKNSDNVTAIRPQLNDLRESGAIEQDADMVCFIHRPEYYKIMVDSQNNDLRGKAEFIIAKHRNGAVGDVRLRFIGKLTRFQNLDDALTEEKDLRDATQKRVESAMNGEDTFPVEGPISEMDADRIMGLLTPDPDQKPVF